jgi:alpha,alpha-trehalase
MSDWSLVYDTYEPAKEGHREALCALGNGYFVTRGAAAESATDGTHYPGTYLAGGYNRLETEIAGRAIENEDLVNLPNWLPLRLRIGEGQWLSPDRMELLDYRQELDMRRGVLTRTMRLRDPDGRTTRWRERRLVSMADPHLAALEVEITALDWSGPVTLESGLDGSVINDGVARYRQLASRHLETLAAREPDGHTLFLHTRFNQARLEVALAARTRLWRAGETIEPPRRCEQRPEGIAQEISLDLDAGARLLVEKTVALYTSRDPAISEAGLAALDKVAQAPRFAALLDAHRRAWAHLWDECQIDIKDHDTVRKLRLHVFHALQTVSYHTIDCDVGVPARGWHGEAYRGHIFWDELFILPFINLRIPALSRALLMYRWRRLAEARRAAREEGFKGAMFPWQSGTTGREESQRLHLNPNSGRWLPDATHRQRHINAAIAYNVWHYVEVTDDHEFLYFHGAELLLEIARFWASAASWNPERERFEIKGVMGPDEFHTAYPEADPETGGGLDNNAYTNVMAAWVLMRALDVLDLLPDERRRALAETIGLQDDEVALWDEVSRKLVIPFQEDGIISQFEGYERLQELDWDEMRARHGDIHRLDRILEAEGASANHYQASKQADVLMLFYLFSADELCLMFERLGYAFERDLIPRNIEYYLARTSHGSTLSWVVHSWVLARANRSRSWEMFNQALDADFADIQGGTTAEGIHLGAMAGTVDILQRCYTGIEARGGMLHLDPSLPDELTRLEMRIRYRRQVLDVDVDHERLRLTSHHFTAMPILIAYRGHVREMSPGSTVVFKLVKPPEARAPCAPSALAASA